MIAKHVPMRSVNKSNFRKLMDYLINSQTKQERVGHVTVTNCLQENVLDAALEIQAIQALNTRTESDKTYHLILSFQQGENPPLEVLKAIEDRVCAALDYTDHQRISVVHYDTDNLHIHVAINKIHPTRHTIHTPYYDHKKLGDICEKLEQEYGLKADNHIARKTRSENRADDMERHAGIESLLGWIKRECAEQMIEVQSWIEMHEVMRNYGLELRERGNGLVITDGDGTGIAVKASSVARELSKNKLEKRLGSFEPAIVQVATTDSVKAKCTRVEKVGRKPPPWRKGSLCPLSGLEAIKIGDGRRYGQQPIFVKKVNTIELYAKYKAEQYNLGAARSDAIKQARGKKEQLIESSKRTGKLKRAAIKMLKGPGVNKKRLYTLTSKSLGENIAKISAAYLKNRETAYRMHRRYTWADWLKEKAIQGDTEALAALRVREIRQYQLNDTVSGQKLYRSGSVPGLKPDNITKAGTIIYRVGSTAIRDDGKLLSISRGAGEQGLEAVLRMAIYRYGDCITVKGSAAFKERIAQVAAATKLQVTFDDPLLEQRRQHLAAILSKEILREPENSPQLLIKKEKNHEQRARTQQSTDDRGRRDCKGDDAATAVSPHGIIRRVRSNNRATKFNQPHLGCSGGQPLSLRQNCLRNLSELGVVQLAHRSKMLLPRHVPRHLEQQRTQRDNGMRREIYRTGVAVIADREKRESMVRAKGKGR